MRKTLAKIIGSTIVIILISQHMQVFALTEKEKIKKEQSELNQKLEGQQSQIDKQLDEIQKKQEEIESKKSETMKSVESLIGKISSAEESVDELQVKVNDLQTQISEKEKGIQQKEDEYTKQEKLLEEKLVNIYERDQTQYLDVLLTASSMTDFLAKYYTISELMEYDKEFMKSTKEQKAQIESDKQELETSKKELDSSLAKQKEETAKLQSLKNEKQREANKLTSEEKQLEKEIEELEKENRKIQNQIKEAEKKFKKQLEELEKQQNQQNQGGSSNNKPTGSGYLKRPVSSNTITAKAYYSDGRFHGALDYGVSVGTTVMAAADGVVMLTANLSGSYGTYVVIRHANGMQSYYAHGTPGSICVKQGQIVKQGEKIMLSGNSGNSAGPHLHFEVRVSPYSYSYSAKAYGQDSRVDPLKYL